MGKLKKDVESSAKQFKEYFIKSLILSRSYITYMGGGVQVSLLQPIGCHRCAVKTANFGDISMLKAILK